jgi:hypothetical protein
MLAIAQANSLIPSDIDIETLRRHTAVYQANLEAISTYCPPQLTVSTALFTATHDDASDPPLGWANLLGKHL